MRGGLNQKIAYLTVNSLTVLRFPLSLYFVKLLLERQTAFSLYAIVFFLIGLSDFYDGKLARKFHVQSEAGATLDVLADSFFIFSTCFVLYQQRELALWVIIMMFLKLIEFYVTSKFLQKSECSGGFLFDKLGKSLAVLFYLLPILTIAMKLYLPPVFAFEIRKYLYLMMLFVAILSSTGRIKRCIEQNFIMHLRKLIKL